MNFMVGGISEVSVIIQAIKRIAWRNFVTAPDASFVVARARNSMLIRHVKFSKTNCESVRDPAFDKQRHHP
jgi:hypothetical protein